MDEAAKRRFDAILELLNGCWQKTADRRTYEWRITLTLWTGFAMLIGVLLTSDIGTASPAVSVGVFIIGFLIVCAHGLFLWGVAVMQTADRKMALHYEKILQNLSEAAFDEGLREALDQIQRRHLGSVDLSPHKRKPKSARVPRKGEGTLSSIWAFLVKGWATRVQLPVSVILWLTAVSVAVLRYLAA